LLAAPRPKKRPESARYRHFPPDTKRHMKRYMSRMKNTEYVSMVAMRVWTKCMKSKAKMIAAQAVIALERVRRLRNTYSMGSISTPKSVPMKRQPKGVMPKMRMPMPMMSLPSGGCVIS